MPEHPGRERALADDEPRMRGRPLELGARDPAEHEIPDRLAAVPPLETLLVLEQLRLGSGVVAFEVLEPGNPRVTVSLLAAPLGRVEVRPQLLCVGLGEAEPAQPREAFFRLHCTS